MKIAVFGTGGVGGYYGARLAAAGADISFIARGAHLEAIKTGGLRIKSPLGDVHVENVRASADPAECGPVDMVMVAVKLYDTEDAAAAIKPLVGPDTSVVSVQNGVLAGDTFSAAYGRERVIGGSASIAAQIEAPGVILHTGAMALLAFGEWDGSPHPRPSRRTGTLLEWCGKAGIDVTLSDNIDAVIWSKFVFLTAFSGITCMFREPMGPIREDTDKRDLFRRALEETAAVARAKGVALPDDIAERRMTWADRLPAGMYSSMYHDLMAGKRLELNWLSGAVVDMGRELGVETPAHAGFVEALASFVEGNPGA